MGTSDMSAEELQALRLRKKKEKSARKKREREEAEGVAGATGETASGAQKAARRARRRRSEPPPPRRRGRTRSRTGDDADAADDALPAEGERIQVQVDGILSDKTFSIPGPVQADDGGRRGARIHADDRGAGADHPAPPRRARRPRRRAHGFR